MDQELLQISDAPIETNEEDLLQRDPLAKVIAAALMMQSHRGATVVGLVGDWGTGKTSIANLVVNIIGPTADLIRFEPWMITSKEALVVEFFSMLGKVLYPKDETERADEKRARFYKYASKAMGIISVGSEALGNVIPFSGIIGGATDSINKVLDHAAEGLESQANQLSLFEMRAKINEELHQRKKPIVIVVDDIDRLQSDEIRIVFQLIKSCANFAGIRYLVLYDRSQVLHALENSVRDTEEYLEKIISHVIDVPQPTETQRTQVLNNALTRLGLHENINKKEKERLQAVFRDILLPGLSSIRKVKRFTNSVETIMPGVVVEGYRNVDPADFLALEFIRQYAFPLYCVLREEVAPPAGGPFADYGGEQKRENLVEERRQNSIKKVPERYRVLAQAALESLSTSGVSVARAHAEKRFETDYWKAVYLYFNASEAPVQESTWHEFLDSLDVSSDVAEEVVSTWSDREKRNKWVLSIIRRASELDLEQKIRLLAEIFKWGESMPHEESYIFANYDFSWDEAVRFIATALLESESQFENQLKLLTTAVQESGAVVGPGLVIGMELSRIQGRSPTHWTRQKNIDQLTSLVSQTLEDLVSSERVWDCQDPGEVIHAWSYFAGKEEYGVWRKELIANEERFAKYINKCMGPATHAVDLMDWSIDASWLDAMESLDRELLTPEGVKAVEHSLESADRINRRNQFPLEDDD